jgi:4-amino-4-deoxy-L-arabinose transferase-like glycosyltransferase
MLTIRESLPRLLAPLTVMLLAAFLRLSRLASVPFGWHPDEATKALLARDVLAGKFHPVFFSAFTGREALFVYLEAFLFTLIGEGIFAGRLLSTFIGILTVALTYATGRELFNHRIGLVTGAFLAVSLWHLIASRNGYRAIIQPFIQLLAIFFLFEGLRKSSTKQSWWPFLLAGIFLGLSQYTYTAVRLFPFLILVILFLVLLFDRKTIVSNVGPLIAMGAVAFIVFLPLGYHFWQHPDDFFGRAAQISVFSPQWAGGDSGARLWQSVKETARMWTVWGDINYRFNISGQPVFHWFTSFLFLLGIPMSLWRAFKAGGLRRVAYLAMPLWLVIMLLPMVLSAESLPYYQRAIGTLPAVYFFPALTLDVAFITFNRFSKGRLRRLPAILLLIFFGWLAVVTYRDYFQRWHGVERNDDDRRVAMVYVADYLRRNPFQGDLYLSTQYMQHPTLALLAPEQYDGIHWFDAQQSLPLPPPGRDATFILLAENAPQKWLLDRASGLEKTTGIIDRFDRPVFDIFEWHAGPYPEPQELEPPSWSWATTFGPKALAETSNFISLPVNFGDILLFLGHDRNTSTLEPGNTLELILYWQLLQKPSRQYTFFAHLLDVNGKVVAGFDANEYPTTFWGDEGGERLLSYMSLPLSRDLEPGTYQLEIGVYNQPSGERLPILDSRETVADRLLLKPIKID